MLSDFRVTVVRHQNAGSDHAMLVTCVVRDKLHHTPRMAMGSLPAKVASHTSVLVHTCCEPVPLAGRHAAGQLLRASGRAAAAQAHGFQLHQDDVGINRLPAAGCYSSGGRLVLVTTLTSVTRARFGNSMPIFFRRLNAAYRFAGRLG